MSKTYGTLDSNRYRNQVTKCGDTWVSATVSTFQNTIKTTIGDNNTVTIEHKPDTYNGYRGSYTTLFDGSIDDLLEVMRLGKEALAAKQTPVEIK